MPVSFAIEEEVTEARRIPRPDCLLRGDCLKIMQRIPAGKIDMVFTDLPYGTTACPWDSVIPFDSLWAQLLRICKKNAAMVFTAAQPFTSSLVMSNIKMFRYSWYWIKNNKTSFAAAKYQPMRNVEDIPVFYRTAPTYNPQGITKIPRHLVKLKERQCREGVYGGELPGGSLIGSYTSEFTDYPHQTLMFPKEAGLHPTQKPVPLVEYMIRTYTDLGQVVLDCTCGSGTTGVAAIRTRRRFICIEQDLDIYETAKKRILTAEANPGFGLGS